MKTLPRLLFPTIFVLLVSSLFASPKIEITTSHQTGIYEVGETARWTVKVIDEEKLLKRGTLHYSITITNSRILSEKTKIPAMTLPLTIEEKLLNPGQLLLTVTYQNGETTVTQEAGAIFSPEKITIAVQKQKDFKAFWDRKIQELEKVAPAPILERLPDDTVPGIELYKLTMNGYKGTKIYGYFSKPKGKGPFPARLMVQWAGVYKMNYWWSVESTQAGFMTLNISAHALEIDKDDSYYEKLNSSSLGDYPKIGMYNREESYFLRMYLSCYRAIEFLATEKDWNQKDMVVSGSSQGGGLALVTAGLNSRVTAVSAIVPALCDLSALVADRGPSYPQNIWDINDEKLIYTSTYFDAANFADAITAETFIGTGLLDTTCPANTVFAAYNQITAKKRIIVIPKRAHDEGPEQEFWDAETALFAKCTGSKL